MKMNDNILLHDVNNYFYGQKALTQMAIQLFEDHHLTELQNTLTLMMEQQSKLIEPLMDRIREQLESTNRINEK